MLALTIYDRIEELTPKMKKLAASFANVTNDPDDIYQSMVVTLIERQEKNPTFCQQNDSYILDAGRKAVCFPVLRRSKIESRYTCAEPELVDSDDNFFDTVASNDETPEAAYENMEQAQAMAEIIRSSLSDRERAVLGLVVKGISTSEIAIQLHTSPQAVSVFKSRVIAKLQAGIL
jgi:RNA polymerase sigma factor (sigma-70 family)